MTDEQQGRLAAADRPERGHDIAHPRAIDRAAVGVGVAGEIVGHPRLQADPTQLRDQPVAHRVAIGAVRRMRPLVAEDPRQPVRGAVRVERLRAGLIGHRRQGQQRPLQRQRPKQRQEQGQQPRRPCHEAASPCPRALASHIASAAIMR